jgi:hypothetical protein
MTAIKTKLEDTKLKLEVQDFTNLTKDDILGDLLYTTAVSYFAELDVMDHMQAGTMGISATRLPSEALFSYDLKVNKFMGSPLSVSSGGLAMDVDRAIALVKSFDADPEKPKQFMLSSGMNMSALEHSVPEQLFSSPTDPAQGISTVKALKIANDQGIPIYTIDQSNISTVLPQLQIDSGAIRDIQNAVNTSKTVTISQSEITFNGWTGVGYIIIDPETGAGAYMISGGMNGAKIIIAIITVLLMYSVLPYLFGGVVFFGVYFAATGSILEVFIASAIVLLTKLTLLALLVEDAAQWVNENCDDIASIFSEIAGQVLGLNNPFIILVKLLSRVACD